MSLSSLILDNLGTAIIAVPSLGVVIAYGYSMIRRRVSADMKALTDDNSYVSMLENYKKERNELKQERDKILEKMSVIEKERNEAVAQVGKLSTEVLFLSGQVTELKELVEKLGTSLELSRSEMHRLAVENAKLVAHVSYLEALVSHKHEKTDQ